MLMQKVFLMVSKTLYSKTWNHVLLHCQTPYTMKKKTSHLTYLLFKLKHVNHEFKQIFKVYLVLENIIFIFSL